MQASINRTSLSRAAVSLSCLHSLPFVLQTCTQIPQYVGTVCIGFDFQQHQTGSRKLVGVWQVWQLPDQVQIGMTTKLIAFHVHLHECKGYILLKSNVVLHKCFLWFVIAVLK